jgi:serine/threonine protein kinase
MQSEYRLVAKKGEGTFSEVLKAQCIKNGKYVAIKCMKNHFDSLDQVGHMSPTRCKTSKMPMLQHSAPQQQMQ